jgi:hypothetical protein
MNRKTIIIILIAIFITLLTFSSAAFFINNLNIKKENIEKKESQIKITIG